MLDVLLEKVLSFNNRLYFYSLCSQVCKSGLDSDTEDEQYTVRMERSRRDVRHNNLTVSADLFGEFREISLRYLELKPARKSTALLSVVSAHHGPKLANWLVIESVQLRTQGTMTLTYPEYIIYKASVCCVGNQLTFVRLWVLGCVFYCFIQLLLRSFMRNKNLIYSVSIIVSALTFAIFSRCVVFFPFLSLCYFVSPDEVSPNLLRSLLAFEISTPLTLFLFWVHKTWEEWTVAIKMTACPLPAYRKKKSEEIRSFEQIQVTCMHLLEEKVNNGA